MVNTAHTKGAYKMKSKCEDCGMRKRAERNPNSLMARIWRWHTTWCPGWKAYQEQLAKSSKA
ncbi:MAG: hypothetical protein FJZ93_11240 [Chloroflexi bacterium]|nr:hypothetical protein [Chloroflexota bacterium]MBM4452000.1 hypothetical protein [Chloroflexota bacterium]